MDMQRAIRLALENGFVLSDPLGGLITLERDDGGGNTRIVSCGESRCSIYCVPPRFLTKYLETGSASFQYAETSEEEFRAFLDRRITLQKPRVDHRA
jgi:hypothetical protein